MNLYGLLGAVTFLAATLAACSPALNWREVRVARLTALLPCKPDQAQRTVQIGGQNVRLQMSGCEAAGVLFALSHIQVSVAAESGLLTEQWRTATLANMQASAVKVVSFKLPLPEASRAQSAALPADARALAPFGMLVVQGKDTQGRSVQARLLWVVSGMDVYHVAAYGANLSEEMADTFFMGLRLP